MPRLDPKESTLKKLFALSGNRCAFPGCVQAVVNLHGDLIAEVCHIEAAESGGQRFNLSQSDEDRRSFDNLLILCPTHHKVTNNVTEYPVERLRQIKREHEARSADQPLKVDDAQAARLCFQVARQLHPPTRPIYLPFPTLGPLFKGRAGVLRLLREKLQDAADGHATAIVGKAVHGLGGVGKTRLAIEYAWRHADDYSALLFAEADTLESLHRNLAALCGPAVLNLPEQHVPEEEPRRLAVLHWLREHPGWLLIVDNVDTPDAAQAAEDLLAELHGGHVLLTGRLSSWSGRVEPLELDVLTVDDAAAFLLARTDARRRKTPADDADARTLAVGLGQLALALEQTAAYIAVHRLTIAGYLEHWREQHDKVLDWFDKRLMQYPRSLAVTWQTSFDQLSVPARRLLHRLAWFAPDPIPESLLAAAPGSGVVSGPPALPADTGLPGNDSRPLAPADLLDALAELDTYSLVKRSPESPTFTVHRLVQDVTRRSLRDDTEHHALIETLHWVNAAFEGEPQDVRSWLTLEPLAPHVRAVVWYADQTDITAPTARLMNDLGLLLKTKAQHVEAELLYRRALTIYEQRFGIMHPNVTFPLNNLAQLLHATNRLSEAEPLIVRVVRILENPAGEPLPNHTAALNNLAQLLHATNRLTEAERLMRQAMAIDERTFGMGHPKVARDLSNLAQVLQATNRLSEAESLMRRALVIDEQNFGTEYPTVARDLANLAQVLKATGRLSESEPLMRRALVIDEQCFGPKHPNVAGHLNNLAALLQATNRLSEAEPLKRRALVIDEQTFGPEHPNVARGLNNLATLLQATNREEEAEPLLRRALAICAASLVAEHPNTRTTRANYARLLKALGRTEAEIAETVEAVMAGRV